MSNNLFTSSWALLEYIFNHTEDNDDPLKLHDLMKYLPESRKDRIIERFIDQGYIRLIQTRRTGASANVRIKIGGAESSKGSSSMGDTVVLTDKGKKYWKRIKETANQLDEDDINILFQIDTELKQKDFLEEAAKYGLSDYVLGEKLVYLREAQLIRVKNPKAAESDWILEITQTGRKYLNFLQKKFF
ncbi:MAG: hypothetical protein ACFFC7_02965 [Candidatus Hermodarchaeota archaeon]